MLKRLQTRKKLLQRVQRIRKLTAQILEKVSCSRSRARLHIKLFLKVCSLLIFPVIWLLAVEPSVNLFSFASYNSFFPFQHTTLLS